MEVKSHMEFLIYNRLMANIKKNGYLIIALSCIAILLSACDPSSPAVKYRITFDANGGEWDTGSVITIEASANTPIWDVRPSVPHRSGYNFRGWFSDSAATKPYDPDSLITEDAVLYAGWTANKVYTITFDSNGGTEIAPELVPSGHHARGPQNAPVRNGYEFIGWSVDGNDESLFDFSHTVIKQNITLHAVWKKLWNVSFAYSLPVSLGKEAELSEVPAPIKAKDGSTLEQPVVTLSYKGTAFRFLGWFEEGSATPFDFSQGIKRNTALTAKWADTAVSGSGEFITYTEDGFCEWAETHPASSLALIADIELSKPWLPVGSEANPYNSVFEGNGHTISGLIVDGDSDHHGLFSYIGENGAVRNLTIMDLSIAGTEAAGGVAGDNRGTIENCHVSGTVKGSGIAGGGIAGRNHGSITDCSSSVTAGGYGDVGGIAGINYGRINRCKAEGTVSGEYAVGGITGLSTDGGTIEESSFSGKISDGYYAGGIAGCNDSFSSISDCSFNGTIQDMDYYIGGIAGLNSQESVIERCTASGIIEGREEAGGIVGYNFAAYVYACSFSGSITSNTIVGGIAGISMGPLEACFSSGTVNGGSTAGGIAGINRFHNMKACYSTGITNGNDGCGSIAGLNENAEIESCFWQDMKDLPGIGKNMSSKTTELQEIDAQCTWDDAMQSMNAALSDGSYIYIENTGEDSSLFPLIVIEK